MAGKTQEIHAPSLEAQGVRNGTWRNFRRIGQLSA
jgi:hypothetical protein